MKFRLSIGRRIGMGFGLFIFFALLVVILTNRSLERSRGINDQINNVYSPSVDALVRLRNLTVSAHMLIKHWALLESRADAPEKTNLVDLTGRELPQLLDRIDTLMASWQHEEVALMGQITVEMREVFGIHDRIKELLPSLESYSDPFVHMERNDIAEEGGPLDQSTNKVLLDLDRLIEMQESKRMALGGSMIRSFDSLKFFVLYMGIGLVIIGAVVAFFIVRGIVAPVQRLRSVLLSLGRGVFPRTRVRVTNDEIGDMSKALTSLVEGLRRTTDFSHAVAAGNFGAEYEPLSEEDMLGHALLKMRDELGQRERILEQKVHERTEEVVRQKEEVERQSRRVVELYKNVTDSIRYAKRLQDSILPPGKRIRELLPESFVYYRPKDIVSGDFYWVDQVDGRVAFAAVDCTGHGVPGAFMSLIGHNGLNQAIRERGAGRPSEVLKVLNKIAFEALHKDREQFLVRDGMDMALCNYDPERRVLEYAGANSPLYVVRGGEVLRFQPDKRPIGSFDLDGQDFTDHRILLEQGDMVYIFSDGYADQFGGPKGKKFLYKRFRDLLLEISRFPAESQSGMLEEAFRGWRGIHEQVDDILVIGMRA
ncbi:MAG: SpoIIE family protein phosphatase [Flavobacteriales bacterium]|nr:SpoIIE family protein phosphatase [Flavobacteriales bacterium]MCB9178760.1 SpoIIE family protein phosphatase [Flavobacteriales bacterium]HPF89081.1 SpoIIE family protein phosphatase [Flavobacteriales bacterium]